MEGIWGVADVDADEEEDADEGADEDDDLNSRWPPPHVTLATPPGWLLFFLLQHLLLTSTSLPSLVPLSSLPPLSMPRPSPASNERLRSTQWKAPAAEADSRRRVGVKRVKGHLFCFVLLSAIQNSFFPSFLICHRTDARGDVDCFVCIPIYLCH